MAEKCPDCSDRLMITPAGNACCPSCNYSRKASAGEIKEKQSRGKSTQRSLSPPQETNEVASTVQDAAPSVTGNTKNKVFAEALSEFESNKRDQGLYAKCFAEADGDESKAKARYIKSRAEELSNSGRAGKLQNQSKALEVKDKAAGLSTARLSKQRKKVSAKRIGELNKNYEKERAASQSGGDNGLMIFFSMLAVGIVLIIVFVFTEIEAGRENESASYSSDATSGLEEKVLGRWADGESRRKGRESFVFKIDEAGNKQVEFWEVQTSSPQKWAVREVSEWWIGPLFDEEEVIQFRIHGDSIAGVMGKGMSDGNLVDGILLFEREGDDPNWYRLGGMRRVPMEWTPSAAD